MGKQFYSQGEIDIIKQMEKMTEATEKFDKSSTKLSKAMLWMTGAILALTLVMVVKLFI